jgi:hypothetical protein
LERTPSPFLALGSSALTGSLHCSFLVIPAIGLPVVFVGVELTGGTERTVR